MTMASFVFATVTAWIGNAPTASDTSKSLLDSSTAAASNSSCRTESSSPETGVPFTAGKR